MPNPSRPGLGPARPAQAEKTDPGTMQAEGWLRPIWRAMEPQKRKLLLGVGGGGLLLFVLGMAAVLLGSEDPPKVAPREERRTGAAQDGPATRFKDFIAACRAYSSFDPGPPDWVRAEQACEQARELEPLHEELLPLLKK